MTEDNWICLKCKHRDDETHRLYCKITLNNLSKMGIITNCENFEEGDPYNEEDCETKIKKIGMFCKDTINSCFADEMGKRACRIVLDMIEEEED